jgi:hypothetical protein
VLHLAHARRVNLIKLAEQRRPGLE